MISNKVLAIQIFLVSNSAYIFTVTPDEYCGQEKKKRILKNAYLNCDLKQKRQFYIIMGFTFFFSNSSENMNKVVFDAFKIFR